MKKKSQRVAPEFCPKPIFYTHNSLKWAHPALPYTQTCKHNTIILYQGITSQMNICLKANAIICDSGQVDEYPSQFILVLLEEQGSQVILKLNTSKTFLPISLKYTDQSFMHRQSNLFLAGLSVPCAVIFQSAFGIHL